MLNFDKIIDGLPKFETLQVKQMTLDEVIDLINALEDAQKALEKAQTEIGESSNVPIKEDVAEEMTEEEEEDSSSDSNLNPDGTEKTRQQKADERWEKRQKWERETENKLNEASKKLEDSVNYAVEQTSMYVSLTASLLNLSIYIDKLRELIPDLEIKFRDSAFVAELKAVYEIVVLTIKKVGVMIKMAAGDLEYEMWKKIYNGKITGALAAAQAWLVPVVTALQTGLAIISQILAMLPGMIAVDGEGMSFFLTPKSLKATKMPIVNFKASVMDFLNEAIGVAIQSIETAQDQAALAAKGSAISSGVIASQASGGVVLGNIQIPTITPYEVLYRGVDAIINLIPEPKPMPKFEQLNMITNPGWLIFLMTGWVPAGKQSFGMIGYP